MTGRNQRSASHLRRSSMTAFWARCMQHDRDDDEHQQHGDGERRGARPVGLEKNSSQRTRPIISVPGPPSSDGMTNSPMAGMKTSMRAGDDAGHGERQGDGEEGADGPGAEIGGGLEQGAVELHQIGVERQDHEGQVGVDDADIDGEIGLHHHQRAWMPKRPRKLLMTPLPPGSRSRRRRAAGTRSRTAG